MKLSRDQSELLAQLFFGAWIALFLLLVFYVRLDALTVFGVKLNELLRTLAAGVVVSAGAVLAFQAAMGRPLTVSDFLSSVLALQVFGQPQRPVLEAMAAIGLALYGLAALIILTRRIRSRAKQ
jgi:hypothetical protein